MERTSAKKPQCWSPDSIRQGLDDLWGRGERLVRQGIAEMMIPAPRRESAPRARAPATRAPTQADLGALRGPQPVEKPGPYIYRDPRDELLLANTSGGRPSGAGKGEFLQWPAPGHYELNPSRPSVGQGDGRFGDSYRRRPDGSPRPHHGIDITLPEGAPVYAGANGRVVWSRQDGDYGQQVMLDHGDGTSSRYAHLSGVDTKVGEKVVRGQAIGRSGRSGNVGKGQPHLHFEVRRNGVPEEPYRHLGPSAYPDRPQGDQLLRIWRD